MLSLLRRLRNPFRAAIVAATFAFVSPVAAQNVDTVDQLLANPAQVLQQYPSGGPQMISLIRDVAVAHPEALQTIIAQLNTTNGDQQYAIGSGLAQASNIVIKTNQAYATQIQNAVVGSNSENAKVAFAAITGNTTIASVGAGLSGAVGPTGPAGTLAGFGTGPAQIFGPANIKT